MTRILRLPLLLTLVILLPACTTALQRKEQYLREAGFHAVTPASPAQTARMRALPQGKITQVSRKGKTLFVLADGKRNLLLVGDNARFEEYQRILYAQKVDPAIESRAFDKALEYDGAAWGGMCDPFFGPMFW